MTIHYTLPSVNYCSINHRVQAKKENQTLLEISIANKIPHLHECGGHGQCTTCRVRVIDGLHNLNPPTKLEEEMSSSRHWDPSIRLGCQARPHGDVTLQRLIWTGANVSNLQLETLNAGAGEEKALAILFCDLRNFTRIANQHPTFDVAHMLNRLFTFLGDPILINNGVIYQYAGDEIIGIFGVGGGDGYKNCTDAIRAGLGMQFAIERLNKIEMKDFDTEFKIGIGIHFGRVFVGHIGHHEHKQFAVVGDPMNVASRIQGQNKTLDTGILVSEFVLENLPEDFLKVGLKLMVNLKGKDNIIPVYEILGFTQPDIQLEVQATLDILLKNETQFAARFYDKVFTHHPELKKLFKNDMIEQGRLLTHMLGGIVYSLSRPEYLKLGLKSLGRQHEQYGVKKEHYPLVRVLLLETISEELGEACTPRVKDAWENAIDMIMAGMIDH